MGLNPGITAGTALVIAGTTLIVLGQAGTGGTIGLAQFGWIALGLTAGAVLPIQGAVNALLRHDLGGASSTAHDLFFIRRDVVGDLQHADGFRLELCNVFVDGFEVERAVAGPEVLVFAATRITAVIVVHVQLEQAIGDGREGLECKVDTGLCGRGRRCELAFGEMRMAEVETETNA